MFDNGVKTTAETARPSAIPAGKKNLRPKAQDFHDLEALAALRAARLESFFEDPPLGLEMTSSLRPSS
jgi:hypothetical protein